MEVLAKADGYRKMISSLSNSNRINNPCQGWKDDPAHPAIYPTGYPPNKKLSTLESKIYDLIVRRFLSAFAEDAKVEYVEGKFLISGFIFKGKGSSSLSEGWREIYNFGSRLEETSLPNLVKGEELEIKASKLLSKFTQPPNYYSEGSLLRKMESENMGTKATRAETISILIDRGYVDGTNMVLHPTEVALKLIETLELECPEVISTDLTRKVEAQIEGLSSGESAAPPIIAQIMTNVNLALERIHSSEAAIGRQLDFSDSDGKVTLRRKQGSAEAKKETNLVVGKCPHCPNGMLNVVRSFKTRKRFLGCTNYGNGCKVSAPLPQKGKLSKLGVVCESCKWPMVSIWYPRRDAWKLCPNMECPKRKVII